MHAAGIVEVVRVEWIGSDALNVVYRSAHGRPKVLPFRDASLRGAAITCRPLPAAQRQNEPERARPATTATRLHTPPPDLLVGVLAMVNRALIGSRCRRCRVEQIQ